MFNSCAACRRRLALRAEGSLPRSQWGRLEAHLSKCAGCRRIDEADRALHLTLSRSLILSTRLTRDAANAFDDRVLNIVLNQQRSLWRCWLDQLADRFRLFRSSVPAVFISQVAGGALAAAAITTTCLTITVQPHAARHDIQHYQRPELSANLSWLNGPPVPLEALMDSPSPRAAMLWTPPTTTAKVAEARVSGRRNSFVKYGSGEAASPHTPHL